MPLNPEVVKLVSDPEFHSLPWSDRKKRVSSVDPAFASLPPQEQDSGLEAVSKKYAPKETAVQSAKHDLSIGFRQGASDLAHAGSNIVGLLPGETAKGIKKKLEDYSQEEAPAPQETRSRQSILNEIIQGIGQAPGQIAQYAPAIVAKKYGPVIAGGISALSNADKGPYVAAQEGVKTAANFYLQGKAEGLPTRGTRMVGSALAMGAPTALETGDVNKAVAAAVTGAAFGAIPGSPKDHPDPIRKLRETEAVKSVAESIRTKLMPKTLGPGSAKTAEIVSEHAARLANKMDQADYAFRTARKLMDDYPNNKANPGGISDQAIDFIDHIETGRIAKMNDQMRPIAGGIREGYDHRLSQIQKHGHLEDYVQNYFSHLWTQPEKAQAAYQLMSKRPLEGSKKFLKQRTFLTIKDGLEYAKAHPESGLQLVSNNPIDIVMLSFHQQDKFLMARDVLNEMHDNGLLKLVEPGKTEPGYVPINDKVSKVMQKTGPGQSKLVGNWHAPADAAQIINNYLSPGLRDKAAFRAYLNAANSLNMFQLGFSAYHLGMTTIDSSVSQFALSLEKTLQGARTGNMSMLGKGLASFPKSLTVPFEPAMKVLLGKSVLSNKIMEEWNKPGSHPQATQMVEMMKKAGARTQMDPFYRLEGWRNVKRAFKAGNLLTSALHLPGAVTENAMKWLFEYVVPMQKIGTFHRMAEFEMEKLGPGAADTDVRQAMQSAWRSVDNRMGQMVYDNLFWDKMAKDLLMASVRSVGWNLGTISELGGGVKDTFRAGRDILNKRSAKFTHRMAYTAALPVVVGSIGGVMHYMMTGKPPESLKDYYYPAGLSLPSYMKDVLNVIPKKGEGSSYVGRLGRIVQGKANPAITLMAEMFENKDWRDGEIRNANDPWMKQILDTAKFAGEELLPFSFRNATQGATANDEVYGKPSTAKKALSFVGVTPAPANINKKPYEIAEDTYAGAHALKSGRTKESLAKSDRLTQMTRAMRMHEDAEFNRLANEGLSRGEIKVKDIKAAKAAAKISPGVARFKKLTMDQAVSVYLYAANDKSISEDDQQQLHTILTNKLSKGWAAIEALPDDNPRKQKLRQQLRTLNMLKDKP